MATHRPAKTDKAETRIKEVLDIANKALEHLKPGFEWPLDLQAVIATLIQRPILLSPSPNLFNKSSELDKAGVALWNASTSSLRKHDDPRRRTEERQQIPATHQAAVVRTFGFLLLDASCQPSSSSSPSINTQQRIRVFRVALKAVRFCLDHAELALAQRVLERCSEFASAIEDGAPLVQDPGVVNDELSLKRLVAEYHLLRIMHSWKAERLDLAEHFYHNIRLSGTGGLVERAADLYQRIGASLVKQQVLPQARSWLDRAAVTINTCDLEQQSVDCSELRIAITASQVDCLLLSGGAEDRTAAGRLIEELEVTHGLGNRVAVCLMRFDTIASEQPADVSALRSILSRMLRLSVMTEQIFRTFMRTIHKAKGLDVSCAYDALAELITIRLLPIWQPSGTDQTEQRTQDWLEKALVTYVLFVTDDSSLQSTQMMAALFDNVMQTVQSGISARATHAAQTLIWKASRASGSEHTTQWSELLQHRIFDNAGLINKTRIARKAILNALARDDLDAAQKAYFDMQPAAQAENLSQYVAFKLAIRCNDYDLARDSLNTIAKQVGSDSSYLYACALEAQKSGTRQMAVAALQAIAQTLPPGPHTPALLRCTARMLIAELGQPDGSLDDTLPVIIELFENALQAMQNVRIDSEAQWRAEVQWWSKNAYNLALRLCGDAQPEQLITLLRVCVRFLESWPKDMGAMVQDDINHRRLLCHFLSTSACVVLGRSSDQQPATIVQSYTHARQQIAAFNTATSSPNSDPQMQSRAFEMLKYDLESILKLQQWDELDAALARCFDFTDLDHWDTLADIVIIIHEQTKGLSNTSVAASARVPDLLQKIINTTWKRDKDIVKVARWVRVTFTMYIDDAAPGEGISLKLLEQAAAMASRGAEGRGERYPEDELGWLATTAFNKAVDFLAARDEQTASEWIEGALELARYADDGGELHSILTHHREMAEQRMRGGVV